MVSVSFYEVFIMTDTNIEVLSSLPPLIAFKASISYGQIDKQSAGTLRDIFARFEVSL